MTARRTIRNVAKIERPQGLQMLAATGEARCANCLHLDEQSICRRRSRVSWMLYGPAVNEGEMIKDPQRYICGDWQAFQPPGEVDDLIGYDPPEIVRQLQPRRIA